MMALDELGWDDIEFTKTWHILGDRLIPLGPLNLVGFYM